MRLVHSTGSPSSDAALESFLSELRQTFPTRVRSAYLSGSMAAGTPVETSDIDGVIVFSGPLSRQDRTTFKELSQRVSRRHDVFLDFVAASDIDLFRHGELPAKAASRRLVFGEDIRGLVPPRSAEHYIFMMMRGSLYYLRHVRGLPPRLSLPLTYPDANGEFYGYERNGLRTLEGWTAPGTKALVGAATMAATTMVGTQSGHCVTTRRESVTAYAERIGGPSALFLTTLYEQCRGRWAYRVPDERGARLQLRGLCHDFLTFEQSYLTTCRKYLADARAADNDSQELVADIQRIIGPHDDEE